jgi:GH18 family chitinase
MKGGKKTCRRTNKVKRGCIVLSCVDYENGKFEPFEELDCSELKDSSKGSNRSSRGNSRTRSRTTSIGSNRSSRGSNRSSRGSRNRTSSSGKIRVSKNNTKKLHQNKSPLAWEEYWDSSADARYYYNHKTGEATWIQPPKGTYKKLQI